MKILQVCPRYHPYLGGIELCVQSISERLAKLQHEVSVFTTDPIGNLMAKEIYNGVKIRRFRSWAPNEAYYFSRALKKYLISNLDSYDAIHAHSIHAFPALYAVESKCDNFFFNPHYNGGGHTFFRSLLHLPYRLLVKRIFERAKKIICVSSFEKKALSEHFNVNKKKIVIIPNGIDPGEFKGLERSSKKEKIILCVSRLEKYKGIQYLLKALPNLDRNFFLEVVGQGPYKKTLINLAQNLHLSVGDRVRFYENLSRRDLLQKFFNADLFALLSMREVYGIVVAEALYSGTPCIVANTTALKEWVDNQNCFGINYPVNIDNLVLLVNTIVKSNLRVSKSVPSWDEITKKIVDLYRE